MGTVKSKEKIKIYVHPTYNKDIEDLQRSLQKIRNDGFSLNFIIHVQGEIYHYFSKTTY